MANAEQTKPKYVFREEGEVTIPHRVMTGSALHELKPVVYEPVVLDRDGHLGLREVETIHPPKKVYGTALKDADRYFRTYAAGDKNVGVKLIGMKGSGKTTTLRVMIKTALQLGMPVIMISTHVDPHQLRWLLAAIDQDTLVCFDEFDKNYSEVIKENHYGDGGGAQVSRQNGLLTILDGSGGGGKKLFAIVANDEDMISDFLVNRPGRIRYSKEFEVLPDDVLVPYVVENLKGVEDKDIFHFFKIKAYSENELNFDMMEAIVSEKNTYGGSVIENAVIMFGRRVFGMVTRNYQGSNVSVDAMLPTGEVFNVICTDLYDRSTNTGGIVFQMVHGGYQVSEFLTEEHFVRYEENYAVAIYNRNDVVYRVRKRAGREHMSVTDMKGVKISESSGVDTRHNQVHTPEYVAAAAEFAKGWYKLFNLPEPVPAEVIPGAGGMNANTQHGQSGLHIQRGIGLNNLCAEVDRTTMNFPPSVGLAILQGAAAQMKPIDVLSVRTGSGDEAAGSAAS